MMRPSLGPDRNVARAGRHHTPRLAFEFALADERINHRLGGGESPSEVFIALREFDFNLVQ
jgi:hypothetical protein